MGCDCQLLIKENDDVMIVHPSLLDLVTPLTSVKAVKLTQSIDPNQCLGSFHVLAEQLVDTPTNANSRVN